ncbi:TrkH family potassium uptake protein, partial [bacterium]|nr:TrkH family potassium uptake protein [bacterium]
MHLRVITRFVAILILFLGISMGAPLLVSVIYKDSSTWALLLSMLITSFVGLILFVSTKNQRENHLSHRDGVAIVTLGWLMAGLFGTLPYLFSGSIPGFTNACFESISGFTTTGASILSNIESLPKGILLWRSQTQWFGGMGIIVLSIAIL